MINDGVIKGICDLMNTNNDATILKETLKALEKLLIIAEN